MTLADYILVPIGQVFNALDQTLEILRYGQGSPTPGGFRMHESFTQSKFASMAAQCYVTSVKIMACSADQLSRILRVLASGSRGPAPTGVAETAIKAMQTSPTLTLGDLYPRIDPLGHALNATIIMLKVGSKYLGDMEETLALPANLIVDNGTMFATSTRPATRQPTAESPKVSLVARFVAAMWDDETTSSGNSVTAYRRCCASVLNLSHHAT
jgi:hypothetical protein